MKKLLQGSPEIIETKFFTEDFHFLLHSLRGTTLVPDERTGIPSNFEFEEGLTYEQMQTMIEEVLEESGYYNSTSKRYHSYPWGIKNYPTKR
ncbi:serine/threonine-protein kinase Nek10-like [Rhinatrema bivittatum]|uniref:serine/threonine-protein kinase Nek10-like n=1 Tax=Rhinatrema bivittatum TaxID=194408 RepID=UPI00112A3A7B|nr:serine/threonine-protein kinase Nek10-like [Rhinatrema bivittatum]